MPPASLQPPLCRPQDLLEQLGGDVDAARDLVQTFLDNFPVLLAGLDHTLAATAEGGEGCDGESLRRSVHQIKGVCGIFAAAPVLERAREIEELLRAGGVAAAVAECRLWRRQLERVAAEIAVFSQQLAEAGE